MATFLNETKSSAVFANESRTLATFLNETKSLLYYFLLKEDGGYLFLETGDKITLEQSSGVSNSWVNELKS